MGVLSIADVRKQMVADRIGPLYLILGADESSKTDLANQFLELVEPELRPFNVDRLYGGEATAAAVVDATRTLPLMVPRRIVLVLHAERLLLPKRDTEAAARDLGLLECTSRRLSPPATLVLVAGDPTGVDPSSSSCWPRLRLSIVPGRRTPPRRPSGQSPARAGGHDHRAQGGTATVRTRGSDAEPPSSGRRQARVVCCRKEDHLCRGRHRNGQRANVPG